MYRENHSLNEWFHEANSGEPEIQVPEKQETNAGMQLEEGKPPLGVVCPFLRTLRSLRPHRRGRVAERSGS